MRLPFLQRRDPVEDFAQTQQGLDQGQGHDPSLPQLKVLADESSASWRDRVKQWKLPLLSGGILLAVGLYVLHAITNPHGPSLPNTTADATVLDPHAAAPKPQPTAATAHADKAPDLAPAAPSSAPAASASAANAALTTEAAALIASSSQGTAQVIHVTPMGSDAAAVEYATQGRRGLAWVDLKRKWVILGTVLNAQGQNLQAGSLALAAATHPADDGSAPQDGSATGPGPVSPGAAAQGSPAAVRAAMMQAVGVAQGPRTGVPIWVFVDPDSARSAKFFNAESKAAASLGALITWVPVSYEDQQSTGRVAYILTQLDPMRAMTRNFRDFNTTQNKGAAESVNPSVAMAQVAMKNTQFLSNVSSLETPTVLFCGKDGAPHVLTAPTDLAAVVQIAGRCNLPPR